MLGLGVIEESNSSWSSPVTLVQKGPKNRLCLDARKVYSRTIKDAYPLPHIEGLLSRLQETYYITPFGKYLSKPKVERKPRLQCPASHCISLQSCRSACAMPRSECAD